MRRGWVWAVVVLVLSGCVGIPSSGPVEPGLPGPVPDATDPLVRPIANPPRSGMTPLEVVEGFLNAAGAIGDDYRVAREYLAPDAARQWDPGAGVAVGDDDGPQLSLASAVVTARFQQQATVSSSGVLLPQEPAPATASFPMVSFEGEWRIAQAPPGLLLSQRQLDRSFAVRQVYFLDPSGTICVPDVRLVPLTDAEALATALVSALLAGPSEWLSAGVTSAIPEGMELALGAVPVSDGVARVDLQGPAMSGDAGVLERFGAQLAWTFGQVPGVTAMEVTLDGRPLPILEERGPVPLAAFQRFDPNVLLGVTPLYGVTPEGQFAVVEGEAVRALRPADGAERAASIAVAPGSAAVAGRAADESGILVAAPAQGQLALIAGAVAVGPRIDGRERIWWTDAAGRVLLAPLTGADGAVPTAVEVVVESPGGRVLAIRPSRDGTRAALLVDDGSERVLRVGVVSADDGRASIAGLRTLPVAGSATDVAWRDADALTVLIAGKGLVQRLDLLGSVGASFAVPEAATSVTDAPGADVVLGLADSTAGRLTGDGVRVVSGLTAPAYPG
jgi:hypothetical protein